MKLLRGFTLIELMIVVAIVAILTSIAVPSYNDYVIRGRLVDGTAALADGRIKIEQFFQDNLTYVGADTAVPSRCPATTANFTYACTGLSTTNYTITATGRGMVSAFSYTIDQANLKQTTGFKSGWGTPTQPCWITTKGGTC